MYGIGRRVGISAYVSKAYYKRIQKVGEFGVAWPHYQILYLVYAISKLYMNNTKEDE